MGGWLRVLGCVAVLLLPAGAALAQDPYESIYVPQGPPREEEGVNAGGVNFELRVSYLTDYIYRGVDQSERLSSLDGDGVFVPDADVGSEDAPNNLRR